VTCRTVEVTLAAGAGGASGPARTAGPAGEYPCTLIPEATVEQLAGNALEPGDTNTFNHDENGVLWTAAECIWPSPPGPAIEVELEVTDAAGPSGRPAGRCSASRRRPGGPPTATWSWVDPGTELTAGIARLLRGMVVDVRERTGQRGHPASRRRRRRHRGPRSPLIRRAFTLPNGRLTHHTITSPAGA
jgi:hypothetical protein